MLQPLQSADPGEVAECRARRETISIDGIYLDSLEWTEASAGWGQAQRNASVMGTPMAMAGRICHRGIGTHAHSRIVYEVPEGHARFAATIGCDQEVTANSVVFVVEGDGRELYRSPLMRVNDDPIDIGVPIGGIKRLALVLKDGGDGIIADHGDWGDARVLR